MLLFLVNYLTIILQNGGFIQMPHRFHFFRTFIAVSSALCCVLFSSCGVSQNEINSSSYEMTSGTLYLQTSSQESTIYPAENPPADVNPFKEEAISSNVSSSVQTATSTSESADQTTASSEIMQSSAAVASDSSSSAENSSNLQKIQEVRAVWFSYLEFKELLTNKSEAEFKANIETAFKNVRDSGFNTVFVQVRPFSDALYQSAYFPWSYLITGEEGVNPGFDPLQIMVDIAKLQGLRIEAWINPYRVRIDPQKDPVSDENPAMQMMDAGTNDVISYQGGIYYNPASEAARSLIVNGVKEIIENYEVDGIHFDDYFYPTDSPDFDKSSYDAYKQQGGDLSLGNWRRENVNLLVREVYSTIKSVNPNLVFGISPQGNNENNYNKQFIDVATWVSQPGYVDYICPQIYFGFLNETAPFDRTVKEWSRMIKNDDVSLYVGLSPYKLGNVDQWAGSGENEWLDTQDLLKQMVLTAREQPHYGGFAMYRYASLFMPPESTKDQIQLELKNLEEILK